MNAAHQTKEYRFHGFTLTASSRKLCGPDDTVIPLSSRAFDTLLTLVRHQGQTLSKSFLLETVWPGAVVEENNLNQAIFSLRKALGDSRDNIRFIQTIPGRGYCFVAELESLAADDDQTTPDKDGNAPETGNEPQSLLPARQQIRQPWVPMVLLLLVAVSLIAVYLNRDHADDIAAADEQPQPSSSWEAIPDSVAVLPFTSLNPENSPDLFTTGLHDEVNSQLTRISSLKVIARNSVMTLAERGLSMQEIGRTLRVKSVVTGSIMFAGEHARINLQMIDPMTGITRWSESYETDTSSLEDMLSIQSTIALNVAEALQAEIKQQEHELITAIPTHSFEAYRYNLAARNAHYYQDFEREWTLARQALDLDPDFRDALYTFSTVNTVLLATPLEGFSSQDHFRLAVESAEKLIALAPDSSDGYALKAVALSSSRDWEGVAEQVRKLNEIGMPLSEMKFVSLVLMCLGQFQEAIDIYNANLVTEPLNLFGRGFLMGAYEASGQPEKSREEFLIGEELNQVWWGDTINIFLALGRGEPLRDVDQLNSISDELRHTLHNINDVEAVRNALKDYLHSADKISVEAVYYSALAANLGEHEKAVHLLRIALQDVWTSLWWVWLPVFEDTRKTESFRQLLEESGVVDYWRKYGWPQVCQPLGSAFTCDVSDSI